MATIVILEHRLQRGLGTPYLTHVFAEKWRRDGHRVLVHYGPDNPPEGDLAILHVDLTTIPDDYAALVARYPRVINGKVRSIAKRSFSQLLVTRDTDWTGPVIVKTDANFGGHPEERLRQRAARSGATGEIPDSAIVNAYPIHASPAEVPDEIWRNPDLIVEKFLPERDGAGYYLRIWTFFGDRERSTRYRATGPMIKSHNVLEGESVPVPADLRTLRQRLGFDLGKFDYVCPDGQLLLLDTNKTPAAPSGLVDKPQMRESFYALADGLQVFLRHH